MKIAQIIGSLFKNLNIWQTIEYVLLIALATVLPFWWRITYYLLPLTVLIAIVSSVKTKHWGFRTLNRFQLFSLAAMAVLPLVYALSLLYTTNMEAGKKEVFRWMIMLAFAVTFIVPDWSFMSRKRLLGILQFFTVATLVRFFWFLALAIRHVTSGEITLNQCVGAEFDPMHHSHLSMYVLLSVCYLTYIALTWKKETKFAAKVLANTSLCIGILVLIAYLLILQSRAGILVLILLVAAVIFHVLFKLKNYKLGVSLLCIAIAVTMGMLSTSHHRLADTIAKVVAHDKSDARQIIAGASFNVIKSNMPFGVGAGDRIDELADEYHRLGFEGHYLSRYNTHNQFLDTLLTTGVLGFLVLLSLFLIPLADCIRTRNYLYLSFLSIVILSSLFESILERQMGMTFFCFFYSLFSVESLKATVAPEQ